MIKSKCYSVPKSGVYRKVKFEIAVTGGTAYCQGAVRGEKGRKGKMEIDETIKKDFCGWNAMHRIYRAAFTAAQRTRKTAIRLLMSVTVFWRYWAGSGKNLRQGSITAIQR